MIELAGRIAGEGLGFVVRLDVYLEGDSSSLSVGIWVTLLLGGFG